MKFKKLLCVMGVSTFMGLGACKSTSSIVDLQILMSSDTHGKLVGFDYALDTIDTKGSLSQMNKAIKAIRTDKDKSLLIDCGDAIQGNYAEMFWKDEGAHPMIGAYNVMNYDVFVPGNHEFNNGVPYLQSQLKLFKGKALCGNVYENDQSGKAKDTPIADQYTIFEKSGVKVAVIGMVTHLITHWDGEKLTNYTVKNAVDETTTLANKIKEEGLADVVVAAEHMGFPKEYGESGTSVTELCQKCPNIDVVLAAHEHSLYESQTINGVLCVENKSNAQTLSEVKIKVEKNSEGKYVVKEKSAKSYKMSNYGEDKDVEDFAKPYHERAVKDAETVVGTMKNGPLAREFEIKKVPSTFMEATPLSNFVNQMQLTYGKKYLSSEASISVDDIKVAVTAFGNYNANLKTEEIRKCDVSNIYKYENTLYVLKMNGKQLKKFMEYSAQFYNQYKDKDLTISFNIGGGESSFSIFNYDIFLGVDYEIDVSSPVWSRIKNVKWAGTDTLVTDDETFGIVCNNYRANTHLLSKVIYGEEEKPTLVQPDLNQGKGIREMIVDYIQGDLKGTLDASTFNRENWKLIGNNWNVDKHQQAVDLINEGKLDIGSTNTKTITEDDLPKK